MEKGTIITATVINDLVFDQRMIRICRSLTKQYAVELVGRKLSDSPELNSEPYEQKRLTCFFTRGKLFYLEYNIRLFFYLLFKRVDVVYAVDLDTLPAGWLASRLQGKKLVFDAHEWFTRVPELSGRPISTKIWEFIARSIIPKAHLTMTVNQSLAKIFKQAYGVEFAVIRNLPYRFNGKEEDIGIKFPSKTIFYQGALNVGRGLETAIKAMDHLQGMYLYLVGEGDLSRHLRELAAGLQAADRIRFLGRQRPEALPKLTKQAWLGINVLDPDSSNYYYSLANKCMDYIQAGVPAINMEFPEYQRIHNTWRIGDLLDDLSLEKYVQSVRKFEDEDFYNQCKKACGEAAKELCWESEETRLLELMEEL